MYEDNESVWKGLAGALVGAIPGILLWVIIGYFGYVASVVGLVIAAGILFCYDKFGGPMHVAGIVICVIVLLAALYAGVHLSWSVQLQSAFNKFMAEEGYAERVGLWECITHLHKYLGILGLNGKFAASVAKGYLFGLLGGAGLFVKLVRS